MHTHVLTHVHTHMLSHTCPLRIHTCARARAHSHTYSHVQPGTQFQGQFLPLCGHCQLSVWGYNCPILGSSLSLGPNHQHSFSYNYLYILITWAIHTNVFFTKLKTSDKGKSPLTFSIILNTLELPRYNYYVHLECILSDFLLYIQISYVYL